MGHGKRFVCSVLFRFRQHRLLTLLRDLRATNCKFIHSAGFFVGTKWTLYVDLTKLTFFNLFFF
jgi:hypothetical protein